MERKAIQFRLETAKGIHTAHVFPNKWRSTPKQLKPKLAFAPVSDKMEMLRKNGANIKDATQLGADWEGKI